MTSAIRTTGERLPASSWAPTVVWVFMTSHSSGPSGPSLSRTRSGIAIFPMSCIEDACRICWASSSRHAGVEGELRAHAAHARDVDAGGVVARLGRVREAADQLELGLAEVGGALADLGLELGVVPRELLLGERQREGERAEHLAHGLRVGVEDAVEVLLADLDGLGLVDRDDGGQARRGVQDADLAEHVAAEEALEDEAGIAARPDDGELPARDDVHRLALVALAEDDLARAEAAAARVPGQVAERLPGQPGQQLDARELFRLDRCVEAIDDRGQILLPARQWRSALCRAIP